MDSLRCHIEDFLPVSHDKVFPDITPEDITEEMRLMFSPHTHADRVLEANIDLFSRTSAIPFLNRFRHFVGELPDVGKIEKLDFLDADELSAKLGLELDDLLQVIIQLGTPPEMIHYDPSNVISLAPGLDTVVVEEILWRQKYELLEAEITPPTMKNLMGVSIEKIYRMLRDSGIEPRDEINGIITKRLYPKEILYRLRAEVLMFPPARENKNLLQIMGDIGCSQTWAEDRAIHDDTADIMWSSTSHRLIEHHSPEFQQRLAQEHDALPEQVSGKMRTIPVIATELGRDVDWVTARLVAHFPKQVIRVKKGKPYPHFDESVFSDLKRQSEEQFEIPFVTADMVTRKELAQRLATTYQTIEPQLKKLGLKPVERRSLFNGKTIKVYERSILQTLAREIIQERAARLTEYEGVVRQLQGRHDLNEDQQKVLKVALQQRAITSKYLRRAQESYDRLFAEAA